MQSDPEFPIRQPSLVDQVCEIITRGINDGSFGPGSLLPSENQLAEQYRVSRSTIRAAFARLQEQGFVKSQRGVGTFVSESPYLLNPLYQQLGVYDRISALSLDPGVILENSEIVEVSDRIAEKLSIKAGGSALCVKRVFTANHSPILWFVGYIPQWVFEEHLTSEQVLTPGTTKPFYKFFALHCNTHVKYLSSKIRPKIAENCDLPGEFDQMESNTPILFMENIGFDSCDDILFLTLEFWVGEESTIHVIRHVDDLA